jgi:4-diphosphocytidyl-2-C-methyl-D-erythritol kinase
MLSFPHAKINLGLHILRKRVDGFHDLETCFYPVRETCDALEMIPAQDAETLEIMGMEWHEPIEKNLVWKAYQMFRTLVPEFPPQKWFLLKKIPTGGGLGGGSSDAAFALKMMASQMGWEPHDPRLFEMAARLGSDCACFLYDQPAFGRGRGEILEPLSLDLSAYRIELVFPGIHISTAEAFAGILPKTPSIPLSKILRLPVSEWKTLLHNDFEESLFPKYPMLKAAKEALYQKGAVYAAMSGSGSAMFGLFPATLGKG